MWNDVVNRRFVFSMFIFIVFRGLLFSLLLDFLHHLAFLVLNLETTTFLLNQVLMRLHLLRVERYGLTTFQTFCSIGVIFGVLKNI